MTDFHAPYNFIPTTGKVNGQATSTVKWQQTKEEQKGPENAPHIRHDKWGKGLLNGRIVCRLTLQTPTVVGSEQQSGSEFTAGKVEPYKVNDELAIPGSSLRGMIGSIIESLSQSAMRVLDNPTLSVRKSMGESVSAFGLLKEKNGELKLNPFTVGTLKLKNGQFQLSDKERKLFSEKSSWNEVLPVYLNGYQKAKDRNGNNIQRITKGSYLDDPTLNSFMRKTTKIYWAKLAGPTYSIQDPIGSNTQGLKIKNGTFLLGQEFKHGFTKPISNSDYSQLAESEKAEYKRGFIFILGIDGREKDIPSTKTHEYFIPVAKDFESTSIPEDVLQHYEMLSKEAKERSNKESSKVELPFLPKGYEDIELKDGYLLRFGYDDNGTVNELSFSSIWRRLVDGKPRDFFNKVSENLVPWNPDRSKLTPAEALLGVTEDRQEIETDSDFKARNLASRLRISDAKSPQDIQLDQSVCLKILASPKLPAPSMYFHNTRPPMVPVSKAKLSIQHHQPNGRKAYLHHPRQATQNKHGSTQYWETQKPNENTAQKLTVTPLPAESEFWFHMDFDNLTVEELTLLQTALTPSENFEHRLGLGKPLGLGSVKLNTAGTFIIERSERYSKMLTLENLTSRYDYCIPAPASSSVNVESKNAESNTSPLEGVNWPDCYATEKQALTLATPPTWSAKDTLIDQATLEAVNALGDPANLNDNSVVRYPYIDGQDEESEGFKWFVSNEGRHNTLQQLQKTETPLPTLKTFSR